MHLVHCEWWIFSSQTKSPDAAAVLDRMVSGNPYNGKGFAAIGAREGIFFSDVRLHTRLALRSKNTHIFRPDLLIDDAPAFDPAVLPALAEATSAQIVRYRGHIASIDSRHLTFGTHLAGAYADLMDAKVVIDLVSGRLMLVEEFREQLRRHPTGDQVEQHLRVAFCPTEDGGTIRTFGMSKVGLPEWHTPELPGDQRVIAQAAVEEASAKVFRERLRTGDAPADQIDVEVLDVAMTLRLEKTRKQGVRVRIFQTSQ